MAWCHQAKSHAHYDVTVMYVSVIWVVIGSANGLWPVLAPTITQTNIKVLSLESLSENSTKIYIRILRFPQTMKKPLYWGNFHTPVAVMTHRNGSLFKGEISEKDLPKVYMFQWDDILYHNEPVENDHTFG